jgi:3',5'-cyclic AMP phosphodiesterase CpdA
MRLAHCSDLHLLSHDGARWFELANKRWIGAANLLTNRSRHYHVAAFDDMIEDFNAQQIDHVLCTGDITNIALAREFHFARARFDRIARGPHEVTVIPGNHDAYVAEGLAHFAELFAPYCATDPGWAWTDADVDRAWPIVRVRGELAMIGVTTSRATAWFSAYGYVGAPQLARLGRALSDPRLAGKVRVVAIHHPPAGRRARSRVRGLHDHAAFAAVIAAHGAELIVHGHEHRDMRETLPGPHGEVAVVGIASGTYAPSRRDGPHVSVTRGAHDKPDRLARYRVYEIGAAKILSTHVRVWDRDRHSFGPVAAPDPSVRYLSAP